MIKMSNESFAYLVRDNGSKIICVDATIPFANETTVRDKYSIVTQYYEYKGNIYCIFFNVTYSENKSKIRGGEKYEMTFIPFKIEKVDVDDEI